MKPSNVCLSEQKFPLLLSGELSSDDVLAAESHLAECATCRNAIESTIADDDWWDEAKRLLGNSHEFTTIGPVPTSWDGKGRHDSDGSGDSIEAGPASNVENVKLPVISEQMLALLGPTDDPAMLGRIAAYEVLGLLGRGGMGVVFKGYDVSLHRSVAIKMLLPHLAESGAARKRFAREAQAAAAVVDDHVMAIHGVSEWKSVPYFVMPYSRGMSLQKRIARDGSLELREILRIAVQSAKGLAAAHAQGLVHRDVKPANIFLDEGVERVQLMDFGLARAVDDASLTKSGTITGTPQYMSPEQARAETIDFRSDLFSLGSVLYAMCVGHAPFRAETSYGVMRLISDNEPRPIREINPDIPDWLCSIIGKLMKKRASDRFDSAGNVAEVLEGCLAHVQQPNAVRLSTAVERLKIESQGPTTAHSSRQKMHRAAGKFLNSSLARWCSAVVIAGVLIFASISTVRNQDRTSAGSDGGGLETLPAGQTNDPAESQQKPATDSLPTQWEFTPDLSPSEILKDVTKIEQHIRSTQ